jgi:predicted nucleic acid-binding protein
MDAKVVDVSAIAALLFTETQAETVEVQLRDASLWAPSLFEYELANVCLMKCRRHPDQRDALMAAFDHRIDLGIEMLTVDISEVLALALKTGLTAYDASYLWLSGRLGADLVTLDKALRAAAGG